MSRKVVKEGQEFFLTEDKLVRREDEYPLENLKSFRFSKNGSKLDLKFVYSKGDFEIVSIKGERDELVELKRELKNLVTS